MATNIERYLQESDKLNGIVLNMLTSASIEIDQLKAQVNIKAQEINDLNDLYEEALVLQNEFSRKYDNALDEIETLFIMKTHLFETVSVYKQVISEIKEIADSDYPLWSQVNAVIDKYLW